MEGNNPNLIIDGWIPRFLSRWVVYPDGESCDLKTLVWPIKRQETLAGGGC